MKKILLAIVIFLINYSAISQSNSCTISVNNIQDNTICDFVMAPNGYNGSIEFSYNDSVSFNSSDLSFQLSDGWWFNNSGSLVGYEIGSGPQSGFGFYNLEPGSYTLDVFYDDGNGYTCSASTSVTIGDNSTSNITVNGGSSYPSCGNFDNGYFELNIINGQPPYDYYVNYLFNQLVLSGSTNTNIIIDSLTSGYYDVQIVDDNFCSVYYPLNIGEANVLISHDTICYGDTITITGIDAAVWCPSGNNGSYCSFIPSQSGFYNYTIDINYSPINPMCYDSVYIEVLNNSTFSEVLTLCDSIVWNGVTYDSSGVYSDTLQNLLGCDSILILDVTFVQPTYGNETLTACDSVTWNGITYNSSGTFIDTIPNHLGCDSIVTIDVNLVGNYDMRFLVSPVSLIAPPFIFPFINATPNLVNYDFTWDFGDGTVIATNDTNITHEYQYNGVYTVKLIAEDMVNNCGIDTLEKVNLINCSGGPSLSIEKAFNNLVLYPNPARYVVNIDYGTEKDYSNHFVEIVNGIGQVVFTNMMNSSKTQISVSELGAKGLYFINIKDSNNKILVTKHLIVN